MTLRAIIRGATPGPLRRMIRSFVSPDLRTYPSWADALAAAGTNYASPEILAYVRRAALRVKAGKAAYERDGIAYATAEYRWPLLALISTLAAERRGCLHLADFGGSLGSVYFQHRTFLAEIPQLHWSVIEQSHFVSCGNAEFADDRLHFFTAWPDLIAARGTPDAVIFSGVLNCIPDPIEELTAASALGIERLFIDRIGIDADREQVVVVDFRSDLWNGRLPMRIFCRDDLVSALSRLGYRFVAEFPSLGPHQRGLYFRRH